MTCWQGFLACLGAIAALMALCMAVIRLEKRNDSGEFDERQRQIQGNAYRLSFYVGFVYFLGLRFCLFHFGEMEAVATLLFAGIVIQLMVYHIYCLLNHAALPLSDKGKPWRMIWVHGWLSAINFTNFGMKVFLVGRYANKDASDPWGELILAVAFAALALMHLIQYFRDRKECDG